MPIYRVTVGLEWNGEGSPGCNVLHYRTEDILSAEDLDDGLDSLREFYSDISNLYPNSVVMTIPQDVVRVDTDPPENVAFTSTTQLGTGGGAEGPELLALCVNWYSTVRSRSGTGRTFLGPVADGNLQDNGTPLDAMVATVRTACTDLVARGAAGDANGAFGVFSRLEGLIRDFVGFKVRADQWSIMSSRRD